jgi:hypothetical protein
VVTAFDPGGQSSDSFKDALAYVTLQSTIQEWMMAEAQQRAETLAALSAEWLDPRFAGKATASVQQVSSDRVAELMQVQAAYHDVFAFRFLDRQGLEALPMLIQLDRITVTGMGPELVVPSPWSVSRAGRVERPQVTGASPVLRPTRVAGPPVNLACLEPTGPRHQRKSRCAPTPEADADADSTGEVRRLATSEGRATPTARAGGGSSGRGDEERLAKDQEAGKQAVVHGTCLRCERGPSKDSIAINCMGRASFAG